MKRMSQKIVTSVIAALALSTCLNTLTYSATKKSVPFKKNSPLSKHTKTQQLITLNFNDISTKQLLQILAQYSNTNFVISDQIKGNMTIHLSKIKWKTALNVILKSQNLGTTQVGSATMIAPYSEIAATNLAESQTAERLEAVAPLVTRVIFLKYSDAASILAMLTSGPRPILSARGNAQINIRTNSILIRDTAASIKSALKIINTVDTPVRQVEIDARIVSIDKQFGREFGTRIGMSRANGMSGKLEGGNQINSLNTGSKQAAIATPYDSATPTLSDRLSFNSPATNSIFSAGTQNAGSVAFSLLKIGGSYLDLELSALEGEKHALVLASPRIITSDKQIASIKQGQQIPYQTTSPSGGTQIDYKEALLELDVTPQITPNDKILLKVNITNNSLGSNIASGNAGNIASIQEEEEATTVLLNNNQTIVIGGIYSQDKGDTKTMIPFLGDIPLIGKLFTYKRKHDYKTELLIFLTPHIINTPSDLRPGFMENGTM